MNRLYYGDCLTVMRDEMNLASVDLIYLDPPFNSKKDYHVLYKGETGRLLPDQIEAFCDQWTLDEERERAIRHMPVLMREAGIDDQTTDFWRMWMNALRYTQPGLLAYLAYMVERLIWMKGLLRPTGSIYLHCDPTASHYIKVMMDAIFGHDNFMNEIVWHYPNRWPNDSNKFQGQHDTLLLYLGRGTTTFNTIRVPGKRVLKDIERGWGTATIKGGKVRQLRVYDWKKCKEAEKSGRLSMMSFGDIADQTHKKGDKPCPDVWTINIINPRANERMGYKTQKPLKLLERIIEASSNKGDVVFDPFCGCATTLEAAHSLGRKWIGIDIAIHAIKRVARIRLQERLHLVLGRDFDIDGVPRNVEGAKDLWERDKYHFQKWAVEQVDGFVTTKRTADGGIDGRLYFEILGERDLQSMVLEVKGGKNVTIADLRALHSVLEREEALMAGLIIMEPLGATKERNFRKVMSEVGDLELRNHMKPYAKMQILTVQEILDGGRFHTPGAVGRGSSQGDLYT